MDLLLGAAVAGVWLLVLDLRRRGDRWPMFTGLAVLITVLYALMLIGNLHLMGLLTVVQDGLNGWGFPLTHWFPQVPRPFVVTGAIVVVGITVQRLRAGRNPGAR